MFAHNSIYVYECGGDGERERESLDVCSCSVYVQLTTGAHHPVAQVKTRISWARSNLWRRSSSVESRRTATAGVQLVRKGPIESLRIAEFKCWGFAWNILDPCWIHVGSIHGLLRALWQEVKTKGGRGGSNLGSGRQGHLALLLLSEYHCHSRCHVLFQRPFEELDVGDRPDI